MTSCPPSKVKTSGLAGGLSKPYKGFMRSKPLKGPEKICRSHCFLGLPLKGFLLESFTEGGVFAVKIVNSGV